MIIQCENCQIKFKIPDGSIGADGRFVRCSQCEYEWLQKPEDTNVGESVISSEQIATSEVTPDDIMQTAFTSSVVSASPKPFYAQHWFFYGSVSLMILSFLSLSIVTALTMRNAVEQHFPASKALFEYIGIYNNKGLKIEDMQLVVREIAAAKNQGSVFEINITLGVNNTNDTPQILDSVRFIVFNKDWQQIAYLDVEQNLNIDAKSIQTITSRLNYVPKSSIYLAVAIGNRIENVIQDISAVLPKESL